MFSFNSAVILFGVCQIVINFLLWRKLAQLKRRLIITDTTDDIFERRKDAYERLAKEQN